MVDYQIPFYYNNNNYYLATIYSQWARYGKPSHQGIYATMFFKKLITYTFEIEMFVTWDCCNRAFMGGLIQPVSIANLESKDGGRERY